MKLNDWILSRRIKLKESSLIIKIAYYTLITLFILGLFNSVIANEKPIVASKNGEVTWPALHDMISDIGISSPTIVQIDSLDWKLYPPIKYSFDYIDVKNMNFSRPMEDTRVPSLWYRHWLGTDAIGRDVAAGLLRGIYNAMRVSLWAVLFSMVIGTLMGMIMGLAGNDFFKWNLLQFGLISGLTVYLLLLGGLNLPWLYIGGLILLTVLLHILLYRVPLPTYGLPIDKLGTGMITVRRAIPTLLFILALLPLFGRPSAWNLVWILTCIGWVSFTRVVRTQTLKVMAEPHIRSTKSLGVGFWRMLIYHIYPNTKHIVFTIVIFQIIGFVLLEAALSFLGLGIEANEVSLGSLLDQGRRNINAWWLSLYPGIILFLILLCLQLIQADTKQEAMDEN